MSITVQNSLISIVLYEDVEKDIGNENVEYRTMIMLLLPTQLTYHG